MHCVEIYINYSEELKIKDKNINFANVRTVTKRFMVWGSSERNTLLNYFNIDRNLVSKLVEINPLGKVFTRLEVT